MQIKYLDKAVGNNNIMKICSLVQFVSTEAYASVRNVFGNLLLHVTLLLFGELGTEHSHR